METSNKKQSNLKILLSIVLMLCFIGLLIYVIHIFGQDINDYTNSFRPASQSIFTRKVLYNYWDTGGYAYPPHGILLFMPFDLLPLELADTAWITVNTLLVIFVAIQFRREFHAPKIAPWLALLNVSMVGFMMNAQIEGFILLGVYLSYLAFNRSFANQPYPPKVYKIAILSVSLFLIAVKPTYLLLLGLAIAGRIWRWPWKEKLIVVAPVVIATIGLLLFLEKETIHNYLTIYQDEKFFFIGQTSLSLYDGLPESAISLGFIYLLTSMIIGYVVYQFIYKQSPLDAGHMGLLICLNMLIMPYVIYHHFIVVIPAFIYVAKYHLKVAAFCYILANTLILRAIFGIDLIVLDLAYIVVLVMAIVLIQKYDEPPLLSDPQQNSIAPSSEI